MFLKECCVFSIFQYSGTVSGLMSKFLTRPQIHLVPATHRVLREATNFSAKN